MYELEEAAKMFNRLLEIEPRNDEARRRLNECCAMMNQNYQMMKVVKRQQKVGGSGLSSWIDWRTELVGGLRNL